MLMNHSNFRPGQIAVPRITEWHKSIPLLRGTLTAYHWLPLEEGADREYAVADISFRCPFCKHWNGRPIRHTHSWGRLKSLVDAPNQVMHRASHCACPDNFPHGLYIGIDPFGRHVIDPFEVRWRPSRSLIVQRYRARKELAGLNGKLSDLEARIRNATQSESGVAE